jgi:hypothetical protein
MLNTIDNNDDSVENSEHTPVSVLTVENAIPPNKKEGEHYSVKSPSRGGARAGAGRPKGSTSLITSASLLKAIDEQFKRPLEDIIAEGYFDAVSNGDRKMRIEYERMLLGKLVAERHAVEVENVEDAMKAKEEAFNEALTALTTLTSINKH